MSGLSDLYQEILLEHNSKPRNFKALKDANQTSEGYNPLCGDQITLSLKVVDGVIDDVGFQGSGCLLYTSPSPRDATLSRMPSSA